MEQTITVTIPNTIPETLNRSPEELGRDLHLYGALMLFRLGKVSSGAAAEMAGLPRVLFFDLCAEYGIPVSQITVEELQHEMNT